MKPGSASVELFWLPLGAGDASRLVRWTGIAFEAIVARREHRPRCDLYHSALEVHLDGVRHVIEMTPVWGSHTDVWGVAGEGPVGLRPLGRSRLFRYEVRCWVDGVIPDVVGAVDSPRRLSADRVRAQRVLDLVHWFPTATWGRDEQDAGEMWNSNSLTSWPPAITISTPSSRRRTGERRAGLQAVPLPPGGPSDHSPAALRPCSMRGISRLPRRGNDHLAALRCLLDRRLPEHAAEQHQPENGDRAAHHHGQCLRTQR